MILSVIAKSLHSERVKSFGLSIQDIACYAPPAKVGGILMEDRIMAEVTYFYHADETLFDKWMAQDNVQPMLIADLNMPDYEADKHDVMVYENPQEALIRYISESTLLAQMTPSHHTCSDHFWCEYRGYVWLFAVIQAHAPYDSTNNDYTWGVKCLFNGQWIDNIDRLVDAD